MGNCNNLEKGKIGDEWGHVPSEEEIVFKITMSQTFAREGITNVFVCIFVFHCNSDHNRHFLAV